MTSVAESSALDSTIVPVWKNDNFEVYSLIWLDAAINSEENLSAQAKVRLSINYLQTFEQLDQCETHIRSVCSEDRIVLVVSGDLGQQLIPRIHNLNQVYSIYIYCSKKEFHQQWSEQYIKVKSVHDELDKLINQLESDQSRRRKSKIDEPLSMNIFNVSNGQEQSTTDLDGRFVQSQLLIACLLKMKSTSTDISEFLSLCRQIYEGNNKELETVQEFEHDYAAEFSVWWYTRETFLYRLLNKALRIQNIDLLFLFRFFIRDIKQKLNELRCPAPVRVYRGQLMSLQEFDILKESKGKFISMNSFLSTTLSRKTAVFYLGSANSDNMFVRVLFEIDADPCRDGVNPFANVSKMSQFSNEEEVLMMLGSVFRLNNIYLNEDQIWIIEMALCSDNDYDLKSIFHHMKDQYGSNNTRLLSFATVLIDMAHFDDAEKYLSRLVKQLPDNHKDNHKCYHALGKVFCEKGNYDASLDYLYKSLKILQSSNSNDSRIGYVYNNIGEVYQKKGDIKQALESYNNALNIFKQTFSDNDENIAWCYNNLGSIYEEEKNYSKAYEYLTKALTIKRISLPAEHPCLSNTYNNLGNVYYRLGEYDKALEKYKFSYNIFKTSLTPRHPSIARTLKNIGVVYEAKEEFTEAMKYYEKANIIREQILSTSHPDLIEIKNDITRVAFKLKQTFSHMME